MCIIIATYSPLEQERKVEAGRLLAAGAAAAAEHRPREAPRHGDQEDAVPGEVLRPRGGAHIPPDRGGELRQPRGQGGAERLPDAGGSGLQSGQLILAKI